MKLYDFDGMFDEKLAAYIEKHSAEHTEREWEDIIPKMYSRFGDTVIKSLGVSPREFYAAKSDEKLVLCLRAHLKQGVPVSEFLCNAIEGRKADSLLIPLLGGTDDEVSYALNLLGASKAAAGEYFRLLTESDDENIKNSCVEYLKQISGYVKDSALSYLAKGVEKECMLEILSTCAVPDDKVFEALIKAFRADPENLPAHAGYLAAYGDERAIPYLMEKIDSDGVTFDEFQELKYAIEALGGTYDKPRDFSADPSYQAVKAHSAEADIFAAFNDEKK